MNLHRMPDHARFLLLVHDRCGSDCEAMSYIFSARPGTVLAGVSTFGVAQFLQPGYFLLPHTGMVFRVALGRLDLYGDGRSFDGHGLNVDVLLPRQTDRDGDAVLELATRLLAR